MVDVLRFEEEMERREGGPKTKTARDPFYYQSLAKRFLQDSGLFLLTYRGKFLRWQDNRYQEDNDLAVRLRNFFRARKIPYNNNVVGNVLPDLHAMTYCDPGVYPELPFWHGESLANPKDVVAYRNGLVDVERSLARDHLVIPHTPNWVSLNCLPFVYDPAATCPHWLEFLSWAMEGDDDRIRLLQEYMGYTLLPEANRQKLLVLCGVPRSGKGTISRVWMRMLGEDSATAYSLTSLADRFGLGSLVGKHAAFVGEVNLQKNADKYLILEKLNSIVGQDPVEIEYKHNPIKYSVTLPTRFVVSCNEFPNFADTSGALAERLLMVNFEVSCPPEKRDETLTDRLCAELPGINNWAIQGLARLRSAGWSVPKKMVTTINSIRRQGSAAYAFLQDRCKVSRSFDTGNLPGVEVVDEELFEWADDLKEQYELWCIENDVHDSSQWLGRNLRTILPKIDREKRRRGALGYKWGYPGLYLKIRNPR